MQGRRYKSTEVLNSLKKIESFLGITGRVAVSKLFPECGLNSTYSIVAVKEGLVKNTGTRSKPNYKWNTIPPNIHMAEKLIDATAEYWRKNKRALRKNKKVSPEKSPEKASREIIAYEGKFFGIKFTVTPIYKQ